MGPGLAVTEVNVWVMPDEALREALQAAADGEPIDLILLHLYANSDETREAP